ncbi:hypothetical protein KZZ07_21265 [Mameliella sp. CS4]|uniref:hypothetical protein n=1 Tax=Mameliella sp. CS4 TaxID=2862329 RepID=UPI001C5F327C|nr:hypothetical protein [Mameliella sp. CS4]MBW4985078.1 hypothetical protein [Mameliella sp. CS4]
MRPVIDERGARLVDKDGDAIPGVQSFTVRYVYGEFMIVEDVTFVATGFDNPGGPIGFNPG